MSQLFRLTTWIIAFATLLGLGLYLGDRVKTDPGYVLFAYGGFTIEMSLWTFLIIFVALAIIFWLFFGLGGELGRLPVRIWGAWNRLRHQRADMRLVESALWLRRDEPELALSLLKRHASSESMPALHWILASEAARQLDQPVESEKYLASAERLMKNIPTTITPDSMPKEFKSLVKALKKDWREDWALRLETVGHEEPLTRLGLLNQMAKIQPDSVALGIVQGRLALASDLEAEAKHHISRVKELDPLNPLVLVLVLEAETSRSATLEDLRRRLIETY